MNAFHLDSPEKHKGHRRRFSELRIFSEENKYHTHDCKIQDHKDSE